MTRTRLVLTVSAFASAVVFATSVAAAAGDLDPGFDGDGKVVTDLGTNEDRAYDVAVQRDGKIVVAGETFTGAWNFALARYNRDGSLDAGFASGGIARTEFGWGLGLAIQPDGKLVVVGGGGLPGGTSLDFAVARYNADGSLDATFGSGGKAVADFGFSDLALDVAIQRDGKILAVGIARRTRAIGSEAWGIARFNPDGSLDASFDGDGRVMSAFTSLSDAASAVQLQQDGKIVVSGYAGSSIAGSWAGAVARYNPDGSLDASFDADGQLTLGTETTGFWLALQPDGKILVSGGTVVRLHRDGTRDGGFGRSGSVGLCMGAGPVLVQADRRIVVVGATRQGDDFTVVRLQPDGRVDGGFRGGRCEGADFGGADVPTAAALQPDRRIVVAGWMLRPQSENHDFAVARYLNPAPCVVPDVRRLTLTKARAQLARANCAVGKLTRKYSARLKRGRVIAQTPRPGVELPTRGKVHLIVSRGRRR